MQKDAEYVFTFYGPFVGALCLSIPLGFYFLISQWDQSRILLLIFTIGLYLILALIVGCVLGLIPVFFTGWLFKKLIKNKITTFTKSKVLTYGFLATLLWVPVILLSAMIYGENILIVLGFIYWGAIVPATLYCALLTRKFAILTEKSSLPNTISTTNH